MASVLLLRRDQLTTTQYRLIQPLSRAAGWARES